LIPVVSRSLVLLLIALVLTACGGGETRSSSQSPGVAGARVVARTQVGPRLLDLTIRSPALGTTARVRLLTPDGWRPGTRQRRPQLWLLHGCCDTYESWSRDTDIAQLKALRRVLVVMPDGGKAGFYSDWRKGPAWETFHLTELRALLERDFGAGTPRAVAGLSMGGYGAMAYAARHPRLFDAAASFSGVLTPLGNPDLVRGIVSLGGDDPDDLWGSPTAHRQTWKAHDTMSLAPRLRGTRLFVSSGNGQPGPFDGPGAQDTTEAALIRQNVEFARRLGRLNLPATIDLYGRGTHTWPYWERELHRALPLLLGRVP
jgi:diacylglycerol O-acyltransferase / trehalose O-mycolyltransferase / mycolyltransferase Ag85